MNKQFFVSNGIKICIFSQFRKNGAFGTNTVIIAQKYYGLTDRCHLPPYLIFLGALPPCNFVDTWLSGV